MPSVDEMSDRVLAERGPGILKGSKDFAASAAIGLGNIPKAVSQIGEMATGSAKPLAMATIIMEDMQDRARENAVSDETLAQQRMISRIINDPNKGWWDVVKAVPEYPAGALSQLAESLSSFLVPAGAGAGAARGAVMLGRALSPTAGVVAKALTNPRAAQMAGVVGTNALMNAGDTFSSNREGELSDRYLGAGAAGALSLLAGALTGGGAEKALSDVLLGRGMAQGAAANSVAGRILQNVGGISKTAGKECVQEYPEEFGQSVGSDIANAEDIDVGKAHRQGTYGGMLGALSGGGIGAMQAALRGQNPMSSAPSSEPAPAPQAAETSANNSVKAAEQAAARLEALTREVRKTTPADPSAPVEHAQPQPQPQAQDTAASSGSFTTPEGQRVVLQNRNRNTPASIQQVNAIAGNPDYMRVAPTHDFGSGAPVVAYGSVPTEQLGRQDVSVTSDGERIPVQYAVVESDTVLTSNFVNGATNTAYESAPATRMRAVAGNGRVAGITEAYRRGNAAQYKAELEADAPNLGIDPAVVQRMRAPVLVRVMPADRVRPDIGDVSNTSGNLSLNAVETAANDVNRIDFERVRFSDEGDITRDSVVDFVRQMPLAEQNNLIDDRSGDPSIQAYQRFANALFKKAYGDDDLVRLVAQAADPEVRNIVKALSQAAGKMARLEGLGDLDVRDLVKQAAQMAVNARRQGVKLSTLAQQDDIGIDPDTRAIVDVFVQNAQSAKEMTRILEAAADFAYSQAHADDMFSDGHVATRQDVLNAVREENRATQERREARRAAAGAAANRQQPAWRQQILGDQPAGPQNLAESAGRELAQENVQRQPDRASADNGRPADASGAQEEFNLTGQTEEEAQTEAARIEQIDRDEQQAQLDAQAQQRRGRIAREERQAADRAADDFSLTDDTVSAEDAVSGQQGLRFSRSTGAWKADTDLVSGIKAFFGTTWDPHESGYMMQDGDMLNMSGSHEVADDRAKRSLRGRRIVDHRDLSGTNARGVSTEHFFDDQNIDSQSDYMYNFMARTGAMRMDFDSGVAALSRQPTRSQIQMLQRMADENDYLAVSYYTPDGRIVDEAEWDGPVTQKKIREFFTQASEKATRGVAGAYASIRKNGRKGGSRSESIRQSLSEDKQLGDAFTRLEDSGAVDVVETIDDLPESVRNQIDKSEVRESLSPMKSVEANIRRGKQAMAKALAEKTSVHRAMFRTSVGWVDFIWGDEGGEIRKRGSRRGEKGLSHILEARKRKDGLNDSQIRTLLDDVVETIAKGKEAARYEAAGSIRVVISLSGVEAQLVKNPGSNSWLLTGFYRESGDHRVGSPTTASTSPSPTGSRHVGGGADSLSSRIDSERHALATDASIGLGERASMGTTTIVTEEGLEIKHSDNGEVQGIYDPSTRKSYLIASNIKAGDEKGVLVHEVGVHMAADKTGGMRAEVTRAVQIVVNGNANGNSTADRARRRMRDAGLIDEHGNVRTGQEEEAMAYLAEEALTDGAKAARPIREWLANLISKVRVWLYKRGLFVAAENLSDRDLVAIAVQNVRTMAQNAALSRSDADGTQAYSKRSDDQDEDAEPVDAIVRRRFNEGNGTWGFKRDELGNLKFGAGEWAYNHMASATHAVFSAIDRASGHKFNLNMAPKEFRQAFRRYRASIDNARSDIASVAEAMQTMSAEERRLVSDVVEKMVAPGVNPPEHVVQMAAAIQNLMDAQTDELIRLGLLTQETAERWRGQYLPRVYLKQTELFDEAKKNFRKIFGTGHGMKGNFLKGRGLFRPVVGFDAIAQHKAMGWEIRDPNWSDAQGELEFVGDGAEPRTPTVVMWRDFTPEERRQMGESRDAMVRLALGYMQTQEDIALARFFESLAHDTRFTSSTPNEDWVKVPDTSIGSGSNIKRYGALAGKWVSPEVWAEIEHLKGDSSSASRLARSLMAAWKEGKTALNPVAHVNNTAGNITLGYFSGAPTLDPRTYLTAFREMKEGANLFKEAQRAGLFSGDYTRSEILEMIPIEEIQKQLTGMRPGYEKIIDLFMNIGSLGARKHLRSAYELEDMTFKYIIYRYARERGMSVDDAVDYAGRFIFNYDDLPSGVRKVRDSLLPFFSWTYKAIPILLHTAMVYPHRFFAPAAMVFAVNKAMYLALAAMAAGADDDWEDILKRAGEMEDAEREALPDYAQGYSIFGTPKFMRAWSNSDGTANFLDMSRLMPGGDMADINNQMGGLPWIQPLMPNSPQLGLFLAVFGNKDAFTGREIVESTDDSATALRKRLGYVYRNIAPALAPGNYHFNRLADAVAAETGTSLTVEPFVDITGRDWNGRQMQMGRAIAHTFGFKLRPFDWEQEVQRKTRTFVGEIRDKQGQLRYNAKAKARGAMSEEAFRDFAEKTAEDIKERVKKLREFQDKVKPLMEPRP